jgi:hypothetical protein
MVKQRPADGALGWLGGLVDCAGGGGGGRAARRAVAGFAFRRLHRHLIPPCSPDGPYLLPSWMTDPGDAALWEIDNHTLQHHRSFVVSWLKNIAKLNTDASVQPGQQAWLGLLCLTLAPSSIR